jgi:hypothetical protein
MDTFSTLFSRSAKTTQPRYLTELKPRFPSVDELLAKAERTTQSCRLSEQIDVSRLFYKDVAIRGLNSRKYSVEEAKRVGIIVDYLAETRRRQLAPADAV